jgi:hypothetical protein
MVKIKIHCTNLHFLCDSFFVYEVWYLALREEHSQKVLEKTVVGKMFGPKSDEVIGGWTKFYSEKFHISKKQNEFLRTGFIWLSKRTIGGLL